MSLVRAPLPGRGNLPLMIASCNLRDLNIVLLASDCHWRAGSEPRPGSLDLGGHNDGVSLPELKKSTNLKMHLKPSVQDVWQNRKSGSTL